MDNIFLYSNKNKQIWNENHSFPLIVYCCLNEWTRSYTIGIYLYILKGSICSVGSNTPFYIDQIWFNGLILIYFFLFVSLSLPLFIDENECKYRPCDVFAQCTNTMGSYYCSCYPGYEGDGFSCKGKINKYNRFLQGIWCTSNRSLTMRTNIRKQARKKGKKKEKEKKRLHCTHSNPIYIKRTIILIELNDQVH